MMKKHIYAVTIIAVLAGFSQFGYVNTARAESSQESDGRIIRPMEDSANCGGSGIICEKGFQCIDDRCQPYQFFQVSEIKCNDHIIRPIEDSANCGKCGNICEKGSECLLFTCLPYQINRYSEIICDGRNIRPMKDSAHCGRCGNICEKGFNCIDGKCQPSSIPYEIICDNTEVYPNRDRYNCGKCGNVCSYGTYCKEGSCQKYANPIGIVKLFLFWQFHFCTPDNETNNICDPEIIYKMYCDGHIIHSMKDSAHCGGCGNTCEKGFECIDGTCQPYDLKSSIICNNSLISTAEDEYNCGKCGNVCSYGTYCENGSCQKYANLTYCDGIPLINLSSNFYHCGQCNNACTIGQACSNGTCTTPDVGGIISFGHYEQDGDTTNGKEPIEWRILAKNDAGQLLVISEKVLDYQQYNITKDEITWERSTIRYWLNGYSTSSKQGILYSFNYNFIDAAFTMAEREKIVKSNVPAHDNPDDRTTNAAGNATEDYIFLLSIHEVETYFADNASRIAYPTRYAKENYARFDDSRLCLNPQCDTYWWLRTPGLYRQDGFCYEYHEESDFRSTAAWVDGNGNLDDFEDKVKCGSDVDEYEGVRPAMWLNPILYP